MNDIPKAKIDTATLLANLKNKAKPEVPAVEAAPVVPELATAIDLGVKKLEAAGVEVAPVIPATAPPVIAELVAEYQQYTASRVSTCLITPTGKRINFSDYQYYTRDPEIIQYLDKEIKAGLIGFIKGKLLTAAELDPEATKKREIIEEFKASQEGRDFGNTKPESERTAALSSDQVAN